MNDNSNQDSRGKGFEINLKGKVSDRIKREIDCLVDGGFDPEREIIKNRIQQQEQEKQFNLLLPESCKPVIGEIQVAPGDKDHPASVADMESYLEKTLLDLAPSSTIALDLRNRDHLVAAEIVLRRLKAHLEKNYIRVVLTPEMKAAAQREQEVSWANKARYSN